ncbi:MAG TPA: PQQ-binding-like beta-propeller repeat protein, partial [Acidimicrobiales bacterium]|nr:PQQ-binding-like beta-propeller repeat protein [Acidimicrobiales bacterium]
MLQGYAANSTISTANASRLGLVWSADLYSAAVDSPLVYYDNSLGKTLYYVGTEHGDMIAFNSATGRTVWANALGSPIRATPVVTGGAIFVGTFDSPRIYKLNATTGAVECSVASPQQIEGTFVAATPPGGVPSVYVGTNDTSSQPGPLIAVNASNCKIEWSFSGYSQLSGTWDPIAYALDGSGRPLILFGTADPDSAAYAVNALSGELVWRFAPTQPPGDFDVGAGLTVSPPGANGFSDGVAYVHSKYGVMYAVNLTTGAQIWMYNFRKTFRLWGGGLSTAALSGTSLVFGGTGGLVDLNAVTGALNWTYTDPGEAEIDSSPAIAGSSGSQVVTVGDLADGIDVLSLATGEQLYRYQTAGYVTGSPAITGGDIVDCSSDGFLYKLAVGGGNDATPPTTTVTSPTDGSAVANPDGLLSVTGNATDPTAVARVIVAVQESGPDGEWWDSASNAWADGPYNGTARLLAPGSTSSGWTFSFPVPRAGGTYEVTAYAVSGSGKADVKAPQSSFSVRPSTTGPNVTATPSFVAPLSFVYLQGRGFGPSEAVNITLLGTVLKVVTSNGSGDMHAAIQIPRTAVFGLTSLLIVGRKSHRKVTTAVTITNNWDEAGYNSSHTGLEPNDSVLYNHIDPGTGLFLNPAWHYQFGSPIATAPAVADDVAYSGNDHGQVVAIDVHNGAPLWTCDLASHAAVDGSPAVDPSIGLL